MPRESKAKRIERAEQIFEILREHYPDAKCALNFRNPLQLLVATILSAQCTDVRVNIITRDLFRKYKTVKAFAAAGQEEMEADVRTAGFFRNKAKSIRGSAARIVESFGRKVPDNMADLLTLPGVARKTANVVLGNAFGKNEGVVVDTHVARLSLRLRLTRHAKAAAEKIERDLMPLVPQEQWALFSHLLVFHGRAICGARKADCDHCPIAKLCPSAGTTR